MSTRRDNDLYTSFETAALVETLMRGFVHRNGQPQITGLVLEPCAGPRLMADALNEYPTTTAVWTNDADPIHPAHYHLDATRRESWRAFPVVNWVVTNPPFSLAHEILPLALAHATDGVAFLMRITYMEPVQNKQPRAQWLIDHADQQRWQCALNPRPNFRHGEINPKTGQMYGTDNATVAWFVWEKGWSWERLGILPPFAFGVNWGEEAGS